MTEFYRQTNPLNGFSKKKVYVLNKLMALIYNLNIQILEKPYHKHSLCGTDVPWNSHTVDMSYEVSWPFPALCAVKTLWKPFIIVSEKALVRINCPPAV